MRSACDRLVTWSSDVVFKVVHEEKNFSNRYLSYDKVVRFFLYCTFLCVCALKTHSINKHKLLCESY